MDLKITALSLDISWKMKAENFNKIETQFTDTVADVLILPEMFSTGFYMKPREIADQEEETLNWMLGFAQKNEIAVCGSASVKEGDHFYNRFYFVKPCGGYVYYDKRHLFSYSGEEKRYSAGKHKTIVEYKGWRILLQTCYDLRFPVFSRNTDDYDAIFYVANWPDTRIDAWNTLLKARAIENQVYVIGVNRTGIDGNGLKYPASTHCFFADGSENIIIEKQMIHTVFYKEKLANFQKKFPFLSDRDEFKIL